MIKYQQKVLSHTNLKKEEGKMIYISKFHKKIIAKLIFF